MAGELFFCSRNYYLAIPVYKSKTTRGVGDKPPQGNRPSSPTLVILPDGVPTAELPQTYRQFRDNLQYFDSERGAIPQGCSVWQVDVAIRHVCENRLSVQVGVLIAASAAANVDSFLQKVNRTWEEPSAGLP